MSHDTDISDERVGPLEALGLDTGTNLKNPHDMFG